MRQPLRFLRETGLRQACGYVLVGFGMIVSAIAHPLFLTTPIVLAADPLSMWDGSPLVAAVVGLNLFNLVAGYLAIAILARRTLALRRRGWAMGGVVWLPFYWLLMAVACVRAAIQLLLQPHHWEKTPHVGRSPRPPPSQPRLAASRLRS